MYKKMNLEVGDKLVYTGGDNIRGCTYTDGQEYEVVSIAGSSTCVRNNNNALVWWSPFTINYNFKKVGN